MWYVRPAKPQIRLRVCPKIEPMHEIPNSVVCATSKASDQPAHTRSLISSFASRLSILYMIVKLLTEYHLEFLSLKRDCRGSSESTLVKMPHCWKSHAPAQIQFELASTSSNRGSNFDRR